MAGTVARAAARILERRRVTRSVVTRISVLVAVAAAVWFSRADLVGAVVGSSLLALVLFCDAVRARMRAHRGDALTIWTASMASQIREYIVYVGLAFGAAAAGFSSAWGWAAGALIALALRDALLVARSSPPAPSGLEPLVLPSQRRPEGFRIPGPRAPDGWATGSRVPPLGTVADPAPEGGPDTSAAPVSGALSPTHLARQVMAFGQPARFLVITVATVALDARIAFLSLIVGCAVAITGELVDPSSREARR
jgi:hypothetical protein